MLEDELRAQYLYDFLKDLKYAYEEFLEVSYRYYASCCPSWSEFPAHLMLNEAVPVEGKTIYRHYFKPSLVVSNQTLQLNKLKSLHKRMVLMVNQLEISRYTSLQDIRITPSQRCVWPLSKQTPGFYYDKDQNIESLLPFWNFAQAEKCKALETQGYHATRYFECDSSINPGSDPLLFNFDNKDFFRIEGHIGQERNAVFSYIEKQIQRFNLPFDVIEVALNKAGLEMFLEDHRYKDIQVTYACNRAEFLACMGSLAKALKFIIDAREVLNASDEIDMDEPIEETEGSAVRNGNDVLTFTEVYYFEILQLKMRLPEDISDFDPDKFLTSYKKVIAITQVMSFLLQMALHLGLDRSRRDLFGLGIVLIVIRPLFDRLLDDCMDRKFLSLYKSYLERLKEYQLGKLFPALTYQLPGYEHLGGVNSGGTFILVYDDMPGEENEGQPDNVPGEEEEDDCFQTEQTIQMVGNAIYANQQARTISLDEVLNHVEPEQNNGESNLESTQPPGEHVKKPESKAETHKKLSISSLLRGYDPDRDYLKEEKEALLEELGIPSTEGKRIKKQRIIADFALPYRCCDTGLEVEEREETSTIDVQKTEFCRNDDGKYIVTVNPAGGTLIGDGLITEKKVTYFVPALVEKEEVELIYLHGQSESRLRLYVYNPIAEFSSTTKEDADARVIYVFTNQSKNADEVKWLVNDQQVPSADGNLTISPHEWSSSRLEVKLEAHKKGCVDTSKPYIITTDVDISLPQKEFCQDDEKKHSFTLTPEGGTLTPRDGVLEEKAQDGKIEYKFQPSNAKGSEINFAYTIDGKTKRLKVIVHRPNASFKITSQDKESIKLTSDSSGYDALIWYVNNNKYQGGGKDLELHFSKFKTQKITVTLVAFSGDCSHVYPDEPLTIDIPKEETVFDLEKPKGSAVYEYCNNDATAYPFTTKPSGLAINGDSAGVDLKVDPYTFNPLGLTPGPLNFEYEGQSLNVLVKDASAPDISYQFVGLYEQNSLISFTFFHPPGASQVTWMFGSTPITTTPDSAPFNQEFQTAIFPNGMIRVNLNILLDNGCSVSEAIQIDFREYIQASQPPGEESDSDDSMVIGTLNGADLLRDDRVKLFIDSGDNPLNEIKTSQEGYVAKSGDAKWSSQLLNGTVSRTESAKFERSLNSVSKTLIANKGDADAKAYLMQVYTYTVSVKLTLIQKQAVDVPKTGTVAKSMETIRQQLNELESNGIQLASTEAWTSMAIYFKGQFSDKPVASELLDSIS